MESEENLEAKQQNAGFWCVSATAGTNTMKFLLASKFVIELLFKIMQRFMWEAGKYEG